ncbi:TetR/AcrR family transcriptional regulator [Myceligenerans crystallogenes]
MARPRTYDDALRTRLLEVASRTISERGEGGVTVRSVAAASGTSPSAVYALFGSREKLVEAVTAEGFRRFAAHLAAAGRSDDPGRDLLALGLAYRASALDDPHFYRVMFERRGAVAEGAGYDGGADDAGPVAGSRAADPGDPAIPPAETFEVLRDAVARVLPAEAPAGHAETVAIGLWGLAHGLVSLELAGLLDGDAGTRERRYTEIMSSLGPQLAAF